MRALLPLVSVAMLSAALFAQQKPQSVRGVTGFENPEKLLRQLVLQKSRKPLHNFCIVGYTDASGDTTAWVDWPEGNALILWEASRDDPPPLARSRRYLDLRRDVVATEEQLRGSTYLVTRSWVEQIRSDCATAGDRYQIKRPQPKSTK